MHVSSEVPEGPLQQPSPPRQQIGPQQMVSTGQHWPNPSKISDEIASHSFGTYVTLTMRDCRAPSCASADLLGEASQ
jgi:hypothetical protein